MTYIVQADPVTLTSFTPGAVVAGSASLTLTLTGTGFSGQSIAVLNQTPLPTTFVSSTQLTATIDSSLVTTAEEATVSVESSSQANAQVSAALPFYVLAPGPAPTVASLSPNSVIVGSAGFTLTVNGANFTPSSAVLWGGTPIATTFLGPNQLTASVSTAQVAAIGTTPKLSKRLRGGRNTMPAASPATTEPPKVSWTEPKAGIDDAESVVVKLVGTDAIAEPVENGSHRVVSVAIPRS